MSVTENDRLNLRKGFAEVFKSERLAEIAMEAMPPLDYDSFATKRDLDALGAGLRGEMAELRGEIAGVRGEVTGKLALLDAKIDSKAAEQMKVTVVTTLSTTILLAGYATAVLG